MAPGAFNLGDNRYAPLATSPHKNKKRKSQSEFPTLPTPTFVTPNPKFVVVSATNEQKPLSHFSCFAVEKSLHLISKEIISVSELRDGSLLLLTSNKTAAEKFIAAKQLVGLCEIKCKYHENLNFVKGTIYAPFLNHVAEEEIQNNLESQGVVSVYKFKKPVDNKLKESGVVLLTFDRYKLPESLKVSWHKLGIREYIPNPMRCKSCQLLGHTAKYCKNNPLCVNCSLPPHGNLPCIRTNCANCAEEHPSNHNKCTKYLQHKEILKIKTQQKCSLKQAKSLYISQLPKTSPTTSYAGTAARAPSAPSQESTVNDSKPSSTNLTNDKTPSSLTNPKPTDKPLTFPTVTKTTSSAAPSTSLATATTSTKNQALSSNLLLTTVDNKTQPFSSNSHSPITSLTHKLIQNNNYYTKTMETSDSDTDKQ